IPPQSAARTVIHRYGPSLLHPPALPNGFSFRLNKTDEGSTLKGFVQIGFILVSLVPVGKKKKQKSGSRAEWHGEAQTSKLNFPLPEVHRVTEQIQLKDHNCMKWLRAHLHRATHGFA